MSVKVLCDKIIEKQNPTVMGLDPLLSYIPEHIKEAASAGEKDPFQAAANSLLEYNKQLIDSTYDLLPAVKPQAAYYELYGWQGMKAYHDTIAYAKQKGLYVIADVKRGDIGSTASAYAQAYLGKTELIGESGEAFGCDSCTVAPYLGSDGIEPFIDVCKKHDKMIFMLVKTSNKSSGELQDLKPDSETVYEKMAALAQQLGQGTLSQYGYSCCGAVVGATYPEQLTQLRKKASETFFLVPGYGAQGAGAKDVAGAFDKKGLGAIINSSRGIMCAWQKEKCKGEDFALAARREVIRMRDELIEAAGGKIG